MPAAVIPLLIWHQREVWSNQCPDESIGVLNPYAIGVKTGSAQSSGLCLVGAAKKNDTTVITVVLGAGNNLMSDGTRLKQQFSETNKLIEMGLAGK